MPRGKELKKRWRANTDAKYPSHQVSALETRQDGAETKKGGSKKQPQKRQNK